MHMRTTRGVIVATILAMAFLRYAAADEPPLDWARMKAMTPRGYVCYRTAEAVKIDGRLDDPAWQTAAWTDDFIDIEGPAKPAPKYRTRAKMLWDDDHFYIAAEMDEPHVWATLTKHDSVIFHDNDFEVFIDPNGDNHEYYELELNALNTTWDLFLPKPYKDGGGADNAFELTGMITAVHVRGTLNDPSDRDEGWSVEIAIPWSALRKHARRPTPPRDSDRWRVDFSRVEWQHEVRDGKYAKVAGKREDNWVWSPPGIIDMHRPERWGVVQFSTGKPGTGKYQSAADATARDVLMEIYHRQKAFHAKHKRWATNLAELGMENPDAKAFATPPTIETTDEGFLATLAVTLPSGERQRWHTRQDSRLWTNDSTDELAAQIEAVLYEQADAWNRGDIDAFMQHYWKSDALTFSSSGKTTRGWQATKENYRRRYPNREAMGTLKFSQLEISPIGDAGALVLGDWRLERSAGPVGGNFSLVVRRIDDRWLIVHDHTSRAADAVPPAAAPSDAVPSAPAKSAPAETSPAENKPPRPQ